VGGRRGALVMQVYEYGDLGTLLDNHTSSRKPFLEEFVWHVLISLSKALLHMQRGSPPLIGNDYDYILHRDLYPRNVFLGPPASHHPSLPAVLLGDIGSSISKADVDARRNIQLRQQPHFAHKRADMYQLGLVIVALCRLTFTPKIYRHEFQNVMGPAGPGYTQALNSILKRCLKVNPVNRLSTYHLNGEVFWSARLGGGSMLHDLLSGQSMRG
jgi:serine/threonine protein kinase